MIEAIAMVTGALVAILSGLYGVFEQLSSKKRDKEKQKDDAQVTIRENGSVTVFNVTREEAREVKEEIGHKRKRHAVASG